MTLTSPSLSRRRLLQWGGGSLAAAGVHSLAGASAFASVGMPLLEPPVIRSHRGVLDTTLRASPLQTTVGGRAVTMWGYNGSVPGPTLRARPGDMLRLHLDNGLAEATNLHTHGLHASGEGNADNAMIHLHPGHTFHYEIPLRRDAVPGTNWYHPHVHGHGAQQIFAGLAGALVIEGRHERWWDHVRGRERVIHLSGVQFDENGNPANALAARQSSEIRLVNGQVEPVIEIAPGETQLWRLVNSSMHLVHRFSLQGLTMTRIAADGSPYRRPVRCSEITLVSGQRADVLVTGGREGSYEMRSLPFDYGAGVIGPQGRLATVVSRRRRGGGPHRSHPHHHHHPHGHHHFQDLRRRRVARRHRIELTMSGGFGIDGRPFDPDRMDIFSELGTVEEWTVANPTILAHPFHIHVNPFQVTHRNGRPVDALSYEDTTLIEPGGSITFRTEFKHFLGRAMFHCHFVSHSDLGMMGQALIVPPGDPRLT